MRTFFLALIFAFYLAAPSFAAEPVPEFRVEVTSYVGQTEFQVARHSEYLLDPTGVRSSRSGIIHRRGYTPLRHSPHDYAFANANYIFESPTDCTELLNSQQHLALHQMLTRGVIDQAHYDQLIQVVNELELDQVTFLELKQSFTKQVPRKMDQDFALPSPNPLVERDAEDVAFQEWSAYLGSFAPEDMAPKIEPETRSAKFWKKVGATWIIAGQVDGRVLNLPHQLRDGVGFPPIDREQYKAVWEIGRTAVVDGQSLKDLLPLIAQRIRIEAAASGVDAADAWIMVRASDRLHEVLYTRYGLAVLWKSADGQNTRMAISLQRLLEKFPPEAMGLPGEEKFKQMRKYLPYFERRIRLSQENHTLGLRYFAPALRKDVAIPEDVYESLARKTLDYRSGEITVFDRGDRFAFNDAQYPARYRIESQMTNREHFFNRNLFYRDHQVVELSLPVRIEEFSRLTSFLFSARAQLFHDLTARGIRNPGKWVRENKIHFAIPTTSSALIQEARRPGMKRMIGVSVHELLRPYLTKTTVGGAFSMPRTKQHRGKAIILIDVSALEDESSEQAKNASYVFDYAENERLLRSYSELD